MFYKNVIRPFIAQVSQNPDKTAIRIDGKIVTNALIAQRTAPIINELDALSVSKIGVVIQNEIDVYAAIFAALFCGVTVVPLKNSWSDSEISKVCDALKFEQILTSQRMHYYFRMTFEDALCRIDNGLYNIENERIMVEKCTFDAAGAISVEQIRASDFPNFAKMDFPAFFDTLFAEYL